MTFYKYHGAGNDFIILDQRDQAVLNLNDEEVIAKLCNRHFGIGADGLMWIEHSDHADFKMIYLNSDGRPSSMCGNGGRCIVALALRLGVFSGSECTFEAIDGLHDAIILKDGKVSLKMNDVTDIARVGKAYVLDTGSPHYVRFVDNLEDLNVVDEAQKIRYSPDFVQQGINVNFIQVRDGALDIRTYERGVEDETLACGTGVTAAALVYAHLQDVKNSFEVSVRARGGDLQVKFEKRDNLFSDIWLIGPVEKVFEGQVLL